MRISKDKDHSFKRGSALLIVLGFLTFITISAIAFSIYMRVERQATSNYMHSITARHLLETALFRAMDEIDGELRMSNVSRFPDWRVLASPAAMVEGDGETARKANYRENMRQAGILSFEALSFLPAAVVNDVRANAGIRDEAITELEGLDRPWTNPELWVGAKWRMLSMPIQNKVSTDTLGAGAGDTDNSAGAGVARDSGGQSVVGQYAYLCVNLSDMLDVNRSSVLARNIKEPVSITHLFKAGNFDTLTNQLNKDVYYASLQDFYNSMGQGMEKNSTQMYFKDGGYSGDLETTDSPYLSFLRTGYNKGNEAFSGADYHVLVTDAFAKAEPCGIMPPLPGKDKTAFFNLKNSPFRSMNPPKFENDNDPLDSPSFAKALASTFPADNLPHPFANRMFRREGTDMQHGEDAFAAMVYDYISTDVKPARYDVPSCKLAPMICGIRVRDYMKPRVYRGPPARRASDPDKFDTPIYAELVRMEPLTDNEDFSDDIPLTFQAAPIQVQVCWPFRNVDASRQQRTFTIEVDGWIHVEHTTAQLNAGSFRPEGLSRNPYNKALRFQGRSETIKIPSSNIIGDEMSRCFVTVAIRIDRLIPNSTPLHLAQKIGEILDGETDITMLLPTSDWVASGFSTSVIVFVKVLDEGGNVVDSVPQRYPKLLGDNFGEQLDFNETPKIFFQSEHSGDIATASQPPAAQLNWDGWSALVVPDPRFNHRASNWVQPDPEAPMIDPTDGISIQPLGRWITDLLGSEGRDSDIFMSVSGTGKLQSPGELGFIIRPYHFDREKGGNVNFRGRTYGTGWDKTADDNEAFFRTIRLYDQGDNTGGWSGNDPNDDENAGNDNVRKKYRHDPVYKYFYAAEDDDGTFLNNSRARVNPLSRLDIVLEAAINRVPYDYWVATTNVVKPYPNLCFNSDGFRDNWVDAVMDIAYRSGIGTNVPYRSIRNVYPELRKLGTVITDQQGWYPPIMPPGTLSSSIFGANAGRPLSEVDRKMLYAFSLDSFSDRQQLFLYIIQTEVLAPGAGGEARSSAGGKAVALVWRDPYPKMMGDDMTARESEVDNRNWYQYAKGGPSLWWKVKNPEKARPNDPPPPPPVPTRLRNGYHEHKILFFKQLDN